MIEVIGNENNRVLFNLIERSEKEIFLCAPFIKKDIIKRIYEKKGEDVELSVITSSNIGNYVCGSLDIEAIKILMEKGANVYNYQDLHAKIYLFDNKNALITSANLTNRAMYKNFEYGIQIKDDEYEAISKIKSDLNSMVSNNIICNKLTNELVNDIERKVKQHKAAKTIVSTDGDEDAILIIKNFSTETFSNQWIDDIFNCLCRINKSEFSLEDIYQFETELAIKYPNNHHIKDKIRQILQQLRDLGFVKFYGNGKYKKLWVNDNL